MKIHFLKSKLLFLNSLRKNESLTSDIKYNNNYNKTQTKINISSSFVPDIRKFGDSKKDHSVDYNEKKIINVGIHEDKEPNFARENVKNNNRNSDKNQGFNPNFNNFHKFILFSL